MVPPSQQAERLSTADELMAMPSDTRVELVNASPVPMPGTSDEHGLLTVDIMSELGIFVRSTSLGRCYAPGTGVLLTRNPDTVLAPDFAFVRKERLDYAGSRQGFVPKAPDLLVETCSLFDRLPVMEEKIARGLSFGVRMALLLDPSAKQSRFSPRTRTR